MAIGTCDECGNPLPANAPLGLCPRCLVGMGLGLAAVVEPDQAAKPAAPSHKPPPDKLRYFGDYELLEEIARGGMGVVYRAQQTSLKRIVAVKMHLFGEFASEEFVKRFRAEAEAAASLKHPNIVAIHEIGEHAGQHYFSMDFVEGQSLAALVREKPLPPRQAAGYLKTIAEAVHYAHQRGVLHRDLKPSNVLIDRDGQPHVTDFGLAKRFAGAEPAPDSNPDTRNESKRTSASEITLTGQVLGSPGYMPPEQAGARGCEVGPVSDIYSLGAMLFHLLTGRPPFLSPTIEETLLQVLNGEPVAPRLLNPTVPRDLETICLKCLHKEPRNRYDSAKALAEDLGRWMEGKPILARPAGMPEKAWRWCRRHPAVASLGATVAALLVVVAVVSSVAAFRISAARVKETEQRHKAEANARTARNEAIRSTEVAGFLEDMLKGVGPSFALGRDATMLNEILEQTAARLGVLKNHPDVEADLRYTIGQVYHAIGKNEQAEAMHREALRLRREVFGPESDQVSESLTALAGALRERGEKRESEAHYREALTMMRKRYGPEDRRLVSLLNNLANSLMDHDPPAAEEMLREALRLRKASHLESDPGSPGVLYSLGFLLKTRGKFEEAEQRLREALALRRQLLKPMHPDIGLTLNSLGDLLRGRGHLDEAESMLVEGLTIQQKTLGSNHVAVAASLGNLSLLTAQRGKLDEALKMSAEALAIYRRQLGETNEWVARSLNNHARILNYRREIADAEKIHAQALALWRELLGPAHPTLVVALNNLGADQRSLRKFNEAEASFREAIEMGRKFPEDADRDVADALQALATVLRARGDLPGAIAALHEALPLARKAHSEGSLSVASALSDLGDALLASNDKVGAERPAGGQAAPATPESAARALEAVQLLRECLAIRGRRLDPANSGIADTKIRLGGALAAAAVTERGLDDAALQARLVEAESLLLEGSSVLQQSTTTSSRNKRDARERLVRLYETWDAVAPNTGKAAKAQEWRESLGNIDTGR